MRKKRKERWLKASAILLLLFVALGSLLVGGKNSSAVPADARLTTEQAQAGAKVLPTDLELKINSK